LTAGLRYHGGGVMAAYVEERSQDAISAAHDDEGFTGDSRGDEISSILELACASDELPSVAEYIQPFQFCDARIDIPCGWNRECLGQGCAVVVTGQNLLNGCWHRFALARNQN
jgi:hypothetical protein